MSKTVLLQKWLMVLGLAFFVQVSFAQKFTLVGSAADTSGLSANEKAAYNWAMTNYGSDAGYVSFSTISSMGVPANAEAIWFHLNDTTGIRSDAAAAASAIETFVTNGGGLFLSGHATRYVVNTNVTTTGPTEVINNNMATADDAWGFRPLTSAATHPIFDGLPATAWVNAGWSGFQTATNGTQGFENMSWWTNNAFSGTKLAGLPWLADDGLTTCGELSKGLGKVIVAAAPGFAWGADNPMMGQPRANLELLTENIVNVLGMDSTVHTVNIPTFNGSVEMYPNPTNGQVTVDVEFDDVTEVSMEIYSITSQMIMNLGSIHTQKETYFLDLSQHPNGMYLVRVVANGQSTTRKLILNSGR